MSGADEIVEAVPQQHALDLDQPRQHAQLHVFCCRQQVETRFEPIHVLAQRVHALEQLIAFGARHQIALLMREILGRIALPSSRRLAVPSSGHARAKRPS